jgi:hypothetical protein
MIGTAQLNEYSEQHGFEVGADRTLCGVSFLSRPSFAPIWSSGIRRLARCALNVSRGSRECHVPRAHRVARPIPRSQPPGNV